GDDKARGAEAIQSVLDPHCLAGVRIQAGNKLETLPGPAKPELAEQGWRVFLVKVFNAPNLTNVELQADSPNAQPMQRRSTRAPAVRVRLGVRDHDGKPTTGAFTIRDSRGRVFPSQSRRLAPDFFFHAQVYRADGETVLLQPGRYTVTYTRGPEYLVLTRDITV